MAKTLLFFTILAVHWIAQFIALSYADAYRKGPGRILWRILATPLVHMSASITNEYFWTVVTANSILWAAVVTYVLGRCGLRK